MSDLGPQACGRVVEELASVLGGSADPALLEHAAECDTCRDALHDATRAAESLAGTGSDFVLPSELAAWLQAAPRAPAEAGTLPAASAAPSVSKGQGKAPSSAPRLRQLVFAAAAVGAAAAFLLAREPAGTTSADDPELGGPPWRGKVAKLVTRGGALELCAPSGTACRKAREGDDIPAGSLLRTDATTLAEVGLSEGSTLSLDRLTTLRLSTRGRGGVLEQGGLVADIARLAQTGARFEFAAGHLDVLGTKFSLRSDDDAATVHVARGQVRLANGAGHDVLVQAGEEGRVYPGARPVTGAATGLGEALGWSEAVRAEPEAEPEARPRALGELKAQKPGERHERAGAVSLTSHAVRVKIAGSVARTEIEEVFTNHTDEVLEGVFRFPLPPDAKIERLALEVDGRLEDGAFVERERAAAIWRGAIVNAAPQLRPQIRDEIVWVEGPWKDPALLEWQRGGRFELRIFPIPKRGSRRVIIAYSQLVKQSASIRRYAYPLAFDPSGSSTPLHFSVDVQIRGQDPGFRVRTPGWEPTRAREGDAERLRFEAPSFVPAGDLLVDYALGDRDAEVSAWAYREPGQSGRGSAPYVALSLRPRLPRATGSAEPRAVALVVDASRSMFGESYRRATALAARMARELEAADRLTVLACDSTCRLLPGGLRAPGAQAALDVRRFLAQETPEGASDVSFAVTQGFAALGATSGPRDVIYIGDGTATVGPTRVASIERAVRATLPSGGRVMSVGIGPESDSESLWALARGGGGTALPYLPGQPLSDAALDAVAALSGASLSDVRLELPEGISQSAPARLDPIAAGAEVVVTGRLDALELRGDAVLRGSVNGRPFEQRYPLELVVSESLGNAFVPRLHAAARIADLERDGGEGAKREAIALSIEHRVASRYTSLLVLESEAMYTAFGLDNRRRTAEYSAELEADGSSSSGELALDDTDSRAALGGSSAEGSTQAPQKRARSAGDELSDDLDFAPPPPGRFAESPRAESSLPREAPAWAPKASGAREDSVLVPRRLPAPLVPMRRIWERHGEVLTERLVPKAADSEALTRAELSLSREPSVRANLKQAFALSSVAGDLARATRLAEQWLLKEPLDPEALTALADVEARRGNRERAVRVMGSVLDVRPGDTASHRRLQRLERWAGRFELACRHAIAIAESKSADRALRVEAVRCARATGMVELASALLEGVGAAEREATERLANQPAPADVLVGDVRLEATWQGDTDIDLALLDTEGHRISWLGAATRSIISARDVTSTSREGLALRGALPGEYVVELSRGQGTGRARGELAITVAGNTRRVPFELDGERKSVSLLRITMRSRLVPL